MMTTASGELGERKEGDAHPKKQRGIDAVRCGRCNSMAGRCQAVQSPEGSGLEPPDPLSRRTSGPELGQGARPWSSSKAHTAQHSTLPCCATARVRAADAICYRMWRGSPCTTEPKTCSELTLSRRPVEGIVTGPDTSKASREFLHCRMWASERRLPTYLTRQQPFLPHSTCCRLLQFVRCCKGR